MRSLSSGSGCYTNGLMLLTSKRPFSFRAEYARWLIKPNVFSDKHLMGLNLVLVEAFA